MRRVMKSNSFVIKQLHRGYSTSIAGTEKKRRGANLMYCMAEAPKPPPAGIFLAVPCSVAASRGASCSCLGRRLQLAGLEEVKLVTAEHV